MKGAFFTVTKKDRLTLIKKAAYLLEKRSPLLSTHSSNVLVRGVAVKVMDIEKKLLKASLVLIEDPLAVNELKVDAAMAVVACIKVFEHILVERLDIDEHAPIFLERLQLFGGSSFYDILVALFFVLR